jgi:HlyD family secretion protein
VREVRATGHVDAVSTVHVGAEISGRISTVEVDYNDRVTAGQVLARFDRVALEAQRSQSAALVLAAKAQLAQARFDHEQAKKNAARAEDLFKQKVQSDAEHEAMLTALSLARARVSAAEASLAAQEATATVARTNLDHTVIRAPIDGMIITRNIDPGQTVASMLTTPVLFTVAADLRKMEVIAAVDEADVAEVKVGQSATFTVNAYQDRVFAGTVTEVRNAARVIQDVVTYEAVVVVDNLDFALKPSMTASVRIRTGAVRDTDVVPNAALQFTPPGERAAAAPSVWTIDGERLLPHPVHPGLSDGETTAVAKDDLPLATHLLVDLTPAGRKVYDAQPAQ